MGLQDDWHEIHATLQDVGATWCLVAILLVMVAIVGAVG